MASAAKIGTLLLLLLAAQAQLMSVGTAAASSDGSNGGDGGCIRRVDEVSNKYGSCQCYRKCSDPEEGWLTTAASQRCFVDCVLRQGCVCSGDGDGDDDGVPPNVTPPAPPPSPPATPTTKVERYSCEGRTLCVAEPVPLPAAMDGTTLRVTVPRPKVSRSRIDKQQEEEMLVMEFSFVPGESDAGCFFVAQVYAHWMTAVREDELIGNDQYDLVMPMLSDEDARSGRSVQKIPIGERLEYMAADGDKTIMVLLLQPRKLAEGLKDIADIYKKHKLTINDVRIEYQRKSS